MKRIKILFLVAILSVMNVCAQSFKVKKGELQIDGTPVAKLIEIGRASCRERV